MSEPVTDTVSRHSRHSNAGLLCLAKPLEPSGLDIADIADTAKNSRRNFSTPCPAPQTPGHHWLDPERGWIQSTTEKMPHGFEGQTLTNPTDPAELAELLEWEREPIFPKRQPLTAHDPLSALADLPLLIDDRRFITQQLHRIPRQQHEAVLAEYRRVWLEAAAAETDESRKDNAGRRAANLYLLLLRLPL